MQLSTDDVQKVAKLARLHLSSAEVVTLTEQLGRIVEMVEQLSEVDTEGVEPLAHALDIHTVLRADMRHAGLTHEAALANAPQRDNECFLVPAVMGLNR